MSLPAPRYDDDPTRNRPPVRRWSPRAMLSPALLVGYLALAFGLFGATWAHPFSQVIGVGPDPPVFVWYLRWVPFAISHGMNPLFTNYLDYPTGINIMWQTSIPLLGLFLWPVTATAGPVFAYNLLMTASAGLSAWCGFLAFRRHVRRPWTAALGGLLFGFSPYMLAQSLGHPHVGVTFLCPLMVIAFEEIVVAQRHSPWRDGVVLGLVAAAQLLISEELLLTQVLIGVMAAVTLASRQPTEARRRAPYAGKALVVAGVVLLMVGGGPVWMQLFGRQAVHGALFGSNVFVTDLAGFVAPTSLQALAPSWLTSLTDRFSGSQYEAGDYLSLPLVALLVVGVVRWWRKPVVQTASILLALAAALSLGETFHLGGVATRLPAGLLALAFLPLMRTRVGRLTPWVFSIAWLGLAVAPILNDVVAGRLVLYAFLFAGLLVSVLGDRWLDGQVRPVALPAAISAVMVAALIAVLLLPRVPFPTSPVLVPTFFEGGATALGPDGTVALVVPYASNFESRAMLWQQASGLRFRMPEGYANRPGPSLDPPASVLTDALLEIQRGLAGPPVSAAFRQIALDDLQRWRVSAVVVGPMANQDQMLSFLTAALGTDPTHIDDVYIWHVPGASQ